MAFFIKKSHSTLLASLFLDKKHRFLGFLALRIAFHKHRLHIPRVNSGVEHHRRSSHRSGGEILNLIHPYSLQSRIAGKGDHISLSASRVRRDEIRHQFDVLAGLAVDSVEFNSQPLEQSERRLGHILQDLVFGMLGRNLEAS